MPLIKLKTTSQLSKTQQKELLTELSTLLAKKLGKPEAYVMSIIENNAIMMSGEEGDAAFAEIKSIGGLNPEVNSSISQDLCSLLDEHLEIPQDRVYINFIDIAPNNWGFNGSTF
ncbi:MAG: phenylpyruvate tautomerase MIF-related protein [Verrucomicrobiota bacterium]|nr:phenylpyruvate tautomerase MIF-related protein [Verrucomicrobiota bacterium]